MFNIYLIPTLLLSCVFFGLSFKFSSWVQSKRSYWVFFALCSLFAVPGFLYAFYYLHWMDDWLFFYEFRSVSGTELLAAGLGCVFGCLVSLANKKNMNSFVLFSGLLLIMSLTILIPHLKPLLYPTEYKILKNKWHKNICLQSTAYTCGAACVATILKWYSFLSTEKEMAQECFTYKGGTENWYLARAFRRRGLKAKYYFNRNLSFENFPTPCIAGVGIGEAGHFITILEDLGDSFRVGDPLVGKRIYQKEKLVKAYHFTGFFLQVLK